MFLNIVDGGFGLDVKLLSDGDGGAKRGIIDVGEKMTVFDFDGFKEDGVGTRDVFFKGGTDDGDGSSVDEFGFFLGNLVEGVKVLKMNRGDV